MKRPIHLLTQKTDESLIGQSHWWGAPDLPEDVPYPCVRVQETMDDGHNEEYDEPLTFLFQLRLEDIAHVDTGLPKTGILHFFAPLDYHLGELESPLDYHEKPVVLYTPCTDNLKPYVITYEDTDESIFRPAERILVDRGEDIILFGTPVHEEIEWAHEGEICLLMLEENEEWGLRFYDCGTYYIFVGKDFCKELEKQCRSCPGQSVRIEASGDMFFF